MTCIVGHIDRKCGCVWIGCDSLASNNWQHFVCDVPKAFRNMYFKNVIMGSTSTFRHIDLLTYDRGLFPEVDSLKQTDIDREYMVTKFVPRLIQLFKDGVPSKDEKDRGASFIVGAGEKLFVVQGDYSVIVPHSGMYAVGSGEAAAFGSLYTSENMDISVPEKIRLALESAEKCVPSVQRPFRIINTKDEDEIVIA